MQGTVASFDQSTRAGSLLTDEGMPLEFPAASLAEHIRHLRVGQRVFVETDAAGAVTPSRSGNNADGSLTTADGSLIDPLTGHLSRPYRPQLDPRGWTKSDPSAGQK